MTIQNVYQQMLLLPQRHRPAGSSSSVVGMRARSCALSVLRARLMLAVERARVRDPVLSARLLPPGPVD
jgi:hypothetical protein